MPNHLLQIPLAGVKIERAFVTDMLSVPGHMALVQAVMALAGKLGASVVAKGIESEGLHRQLTTMGCGFGQGFYYSQPVAASDALGLLKKN